MEENNINNGERDGVGRLYDKLYNDKKYTKSEDEFRTLVSDDERRGKLYDALHSDGLYTKSKEDFDAQLGISATPAVQQDAVKPDAVAETPKSPVIDGKKYSPYVEGFRQRTMQRTDANGNPVSAICADIDARTGNPIVRTGNPIVAPNASRLYEESEDYVADPLEKQRDTERLEKMLLEKDAPERDFNGNVRKSPKVKYKGEERANIQAQIEKNNADIEKYNNYVNNAVLSAGAPKQYENAEQVYEYARKAYDKMKSGAEKKRRTDDEMSELYAEMMGKVAKGEIDLGVDYAGYLQHIEKANELGKEYSRLSSIDAESLDEAGKKAYAKEAQRYNAETKAFGEEGKKYGDDFVKSLNEKVGEAFDAYYNQNKAKTVDENGNKVGLYEYEYMKGFDAAMGRYINENTMPFKIEKVKENHESIEKRIAEYNKANPSQLIGISPSTGVAVYSHGPEEDKITQAVSLQHESEGMIKAYNKGGMGQLARGFGNKITDFDIYTLGITDAIGNDRLNKISKKIDAAGDFDKGYESLTEAEKILWDSYMENGLVMEYLSSGINAGYRAGQTTAEMIPFMVQMALTEGIAVNSRIGQWAMKKGLYSATERGGARVLQSAAAEAAAKKTFGAAVKDFAVKGLKEGTIKGAIGASTVGIGNVAANATERMLGTAVVDIDPIDGKVSYGGQAGQEKDWKAWTLAYLGQTLEMQSEMTGEYIMGMFKPLASGVFGGMVKDGNKFFSKMFNALKSNKYANALGNIRRATFMGGFLEEFSEEMWRNLEGAIIGETEWSSFSKENLLETAYGLLPAQILFGGVNMGGAVKHTVRAAKARKALDSKNPELVERYDRVMNAGTYAAQDFISRELSLIMNGKGEYADMDDAQKAESVEYLLSMQEKTYMDEYAALEGDKAKKDYLHEMTRRVNLNNGGVSFVEVTDEDGNTILQGTLESTDGDKSVVMDYSGKRHEVNTNSVKTVQTYTESEIEQNAKDIAEQAGIDLTLYDVSGLLEGDTAMNDGETVLVGGLTATVESVDENGNYTVRYENADGEVVRTMTHSERELREILTQGVDEEAELQGDIEGTEDLRKSVTNEVVTAFGLNEENSLLSMNAAIDMGRRQRMALTEMRNQFSDEEIAAFDAMDARQKARYMLSLDDSRKAEAAWNYVDSNYGSMGDAIGRRKQRAFDDAVRRLNDYGINGTAKTATYNGNTVIVRNGNINSVTNDGNNVTSRTMAVVDDLMGNAMTVDASELQDNKQMTVEELATMITADESNALDMLGEIYNGTFFALGENVGIGVDESGKMIDGVVTGVDADGNVTYTVGEEQFTENKTALRDKKEAADAQYAEMQQKRIEEEYKKRKANGVKSGDEISIMVDSQENGKKTRKKIRVSYQGKTGGAHTMYTLDGDEVISMSDEEFKKAYVEAANMEDTQAAQAQPEQAQERQAQPKQQEQRQEQPKPQRDEQAIMDMYNQLYQQFGVPVMLVNTPEELAQLGQKTASRVVSENKGKVRGWMSDGEIYIYLPSIESADEMAEVYLHEVIGHKGIRELMKKHKADFDMLCDSVWESMDEASRKRYTEYAKQSAPNEKGVALQRHAADEYIAHIVQEMKDDVGARHVFGKIVDFIVELLDKFGIKIGITRNQIEDLARDAMAMFEAEARGEQYVPQYQFGDAKIEEKIEEEEVANQIAEEEKAKEARQEEPKQEEKPVEKSVTERIDDFIAKHGENAENKLNKTVKAQQTEIASLTKQLAERRDELENLPEPYDEKSQKAEDKKKKQIARLEEYLSNAEQRIAPWVEMQEEMGRRKAEAEAKALQYQANENAAQEAIDGLRQSLDDALVAKPSETADDEPTNAMEFIARFIRNGKLKKGENLSINTASFDKHTGYGAKERKPFVGLFRKNGGVTMEQLGEMLYDEAQSQGYGSFFTDAQDAFDKALGFFQEVRSIGDIYRYVNENRRAQQDEELNYIQSQIESAAQAQGYESSQAMYDDIMERGRNLVEMARDENGNIDTESLAALQELMEALKPKFGEEAVNEGSQQEVGEDGFDWYQQTDYVPFSIANTDSELIDNIIKDNGELDYEAINEVSRRVENGSWGIFRLPAEAARNNAGKEGIVARAIARASERFLGRMGKGQRLHNGDVARAIRVLAKGNIEKWAKHEGIWFTNSELEKSSDFRFRGKESDVYLKNGEQSVIKFTKPISFEDRTQLLLEQLDMFNSLFDDKYEVIGFGKDESGDLCAVVKQNFVVGERIADKYSDYDGIIDKFMKETYGLDKDVDENGFDIYKNDFFIVDDVHGYNVVVDSNGDLHVIDANVSLNTESRKVSYADDNVRFSISNANQRVFVSNAAKAVDGIKQEKATPAQWLAMITKNGGLKAEEDKWIGLSDWLKEQKGSLTKQQVLDFVNENAIQIEEVKYVSQAQLKDSDIYKEFVSLGGDSAAFEEMEEKYGDDFSLAFFYDYRTQSMSIADEDAAGYFMGDKLINDTRLDYTTNGLENKKEIALTVSTIDPYNENDEIHFGDAGGGRAVAWVRFGDAVTKEPNPEFEQLKAEAKAEGMKEEPDYDKIGMLGKKMHEALNNEPNGKKVLVIDEIQSKRHQDGREEGYGDNVPDAPFRKNWHELAMKRMLRYAAENGYDKVAWTTGKQQAERYNIGHTLQYISIDFYNDKKFVTPTFNNGESNGFEVDKDGVISDARGFLADANGKSVKDVFGNELGQKIIDTTEDNELQGEDLSVGGEGMKGFYDKMLVDFMNKYGKKWGVKVGDVNLNLPNEADRVMHSVDVNDAMKESVMEGQVMFSIVTPEMDSDFRKAYEEGDTEKAAELVKQAAKIAMPNTKVVDENGMPMVVYHNTMNDFNVFDKAKIGSETDYGAFGFGFYFTPSAERFGNYGTRKVSAYLDIQNPLTNTDDITRIQRQARIDVTGDEFGNSGRAVSERIVELAKEEGYDGVVYEDEEIVAFEPTQIKSAEPFTFDDNGELIPLSERFNSDNNDIRFSIEPNYDNEGNIRFSYITDSPGTMRVFHGSAADFNKFDHGFMGTGEGSQVYGFGTYVSNVKDTARMYANVSDSFHGYDEYVAFYKGKEIWGLTEDEIDKEPHYTKESTLRMLNQLGEDAETYGLGKLPRIYEERIAEYEEYLEEEPDDINTSIMLNLVKRKYDYLKNGGIDVVHNKSQKHIYSVDIPSDENGKYIEYGSRLEGEQRERVKKAATEALQSLADKYWKGEIPSYKISELVNVLDDFDNTRFASVLECSGKEASDILSNAGFVGVKVPTGYRNGGDGRGMNYVIFNEKDLNIVEHERFSIAPLPDPTSEEAYEPDALTERFSVALGSNPASIDYDKEVSSKFFKMYSALFDGAIALKRMQSAVARGTEIGEFENPYLMEIARVSRTAAENKRLEPLTKELKDAITAFLRKRDIGQDEWYEQDMRRLSTYAICKHGVIDRNPYFYERALAKREEENQAAYEKYESRFEKSAKEYEESLQEEYAIYSKYNKTQRMSYDEWLKAKHDASYKGYLSWMKANKPNETPLGYDEYIEGRNERARDLRIEYNAYLKYDKQKPMTYDEWLAEKWKRSYRGYVAWMNANGRGGDIVELDEYIDLKTPKKLTYDEFAAKRNARLGEVIPEDNAGLTAIAEEIDPSVNRKHEKATDEINEKINNINADIEILKGQIENETDEDEIDRMEAELEQLKANRKALNKQLADEKKSYYNELMAISNSEVLAYENEFGTDKTDRLWNAINAISAEIRDHWREGGIVSKEAYDEMQRRFKYYIPLRGFNEKTTADEYAYQSTPSVQQRFEGFKKMEGRTSRAADPFSTILRMLDSAVDAHYKNDVGKAVFNLALNHKDNGLLYTAKVWEVRDEKTGQWVASEPQGITQGMSGTQIERIIKNHESEMKALAKRGAARPIQYINGKKLPKDAEQHHRLKVMIDGKPVYVFIAGDTKAFDSLNRPDYSNKVSKYTGAFTRFMSRFMTTYKPSFIIRNAMRDFGMANFIMYSQGGWKYMRNFDKNWRTLVHKGNIRKLTKGTCDAMVDVNGQQVRLQDLFDEFYTNGGETGYTRTLSQEAKRKELETELRRMTRKGANRAKDWPMMGIRAAGEYMEDVNRYAEDLARFSIYVTARQNGKSITDAVADAKNGTANFSKKGDSAFAAFMNRNFAFFNASLQGFNTFAHSFKGEGKWRAVGATASLAAMGVMLPIVNVLLLAFNGDDDDWATYENLSQYVTNTNFVLFIPFLHKFITIPYPQELVPVMALGNIIARNTIGMTSPADDDTIFGNITMQWISTVADLMPVNPLETLLDRSYNSFGEIIASASRPLAPTYLSPIYDVVINRNFMGGEIRHKHYTQYNERDSRPYWTEVDASKMPLATLTARLLAGNDPYEASFFNADPRQIEHVIKGYSNGVGDIIGEQIKTVSSILNGTFDTNSMPIVKKFIISPTPMKWDGQVTSKLYDISDEIDKVKKEHKKKEKIIDEALNGGRDASKYLEELRELENSLPYILYDKFGDMNKTMKDFKERKANIMADETDTNEERNKKLEELSKEKLILLDMASDAAEDWRKENKKIDPPAKIRKAIYGSYGTEDKDEEQNND